jgi:hypothetical protein
MSSLDNIKINFEYKENNISLDVPPYKNIKYLKDLVKKKFRPKNLEIIQLFYQNKNISKKEDLIIGDVFKNQYSINIKVVENIEKIKIPASINIESENIKPVKLTEEEKNFFKCSCSEKLINNYCRNCKQLLCNTCRINETHKNHKVIQINPYDLNESCNLYSLILQGEISNNIKIKENFKKLKFNEKKFDEFSSKHEIIQNKFDEVYKKYEEALKIIDIDPQNNEINIDNMIKEYKENTKNINNELDNISNDIYKTYIQKKKRMKCEKFNEILEKLSEKDDELENCSKEIYKYIIYNKITEKLYNMYEEIEKALDNILNSKTLFNIDKDSNLIYEKIKNDKKNEDLIEEERKDENDDEKNSNFENNMNNEEKEQSEIDEKNYVEKEEKESENLKKED